MTVGHKSRSAVAESEEVYARILAYMNHFQPKVVTLPELAELINVRYTTHMKSLVRKAIKCELFRDYHLYIIERAKVVPIPPEHMRSDDWVAELRLVWRRRISEYPESGHTFAMNQRAMFLPWDKCMSEMMEKVRERWSQDEVRRTWEPYPEKFNGWWEKPALAPSVALGRF